MNPFAAMAELADALDSGSSRGNSVDVQVILAATLIKEKSPSYSVISVTSVVKISFFMEGRPGRRSEANA